MQNPSQQLHHLASRKYLIAITHFSKRNIYNLEILQQTLKDSLISLLSDLNPNVQWFSDLIKFAISKWSTCYINKLLVKLIELGKYDIFTVQETKLRPEIPDNPFSFANYTTLRRNRCPRRFSNGLCQAIFQTNKSPFVY